MRIKSITVSGTGTQSVIDAKRETSHMFSHLEWLEPYIQPRNSASSLVQSADDSADTTDITDKTD